MRRADSPTARIAGWARLLSPRLLSLFGFVVLWWAASRVAASRALLPSPQAVLVFAWRECVDGNLLRAFAATLSRVAVALWLPWSGAALRATWRDGRRE